LLSIILNSRAERNKNFNTSNLLLATTRIGKGTHRGVKSLKEYLRETQKAHGKCFVLKCDVKKFFHSINHDILISIIQKKVIDPEMIWLIKLLLESFPIRAQFERERERVKRALSVI